MGSRHRTELRLQLARKVGDLRLDLPGHVGPFAFQPLAHIARGLCDQLLEHVPGNILAQTEVLGENRIIFGALDHVQETEVGKTRAVIARDRFDDFLIAAGHQFVRHPLFELFAFRDREHVRLALGAGIGHQRVAFELLGFPQHGACDLDRIVEGEFVDDVDGGAVEAGEPFGQLRAGRDLDLLGQPRHDFAEGPNLVVAEAAGDHQIGGMPQRPCAALRRPARDGLVEIAQKRLVLALLHSLELQTHRGSPKSQLNCRQRIICPG